MLKKPGIKKIKRITVKKVKAGKPKKQQCELHRQYAKHWLKITK